MQMARKGANTNVVFNLLIMWFSFIVSTVSGSFGSLNDENSRYSFSLTTFSPSGRLQQVAYATRAAITLGSPVIAIKITDPNHPHNESILFTSQHKTPSPLIRDDGTPRGAIQIRPGIAISHSGLGADGRQILAACQRMAIEHEYTFDEHIPIDIFLEEVSLLFQKYTMKPGVRPFGCSIIVAYCRRDGDQSRDKGDIYVISPSGSIELADNAAMLGTIAPYETEILNDLESRKYWELDAANLTTTLIDLIADKIIGPVEKEEETKQNKKNLNFITTHLTSKNLKQDFVSL